MKFFQNLFRPSSTPERMSAITSVETTPVRAELLPRETIKRVAVRPAQLNYAVAQSVGKQRDHNEDAIYSMSAILADGVTDLPFGIFVVADGMGGHLNGEVASISAAKTMSEYLLAHFYLPFLTGKDHSEDESAQEIMEHGVNEAQHAVLANAPGGGTTLTAALVIGDRVIISHVGDSRAYFLTSDEGIELKTQDHSLVKRLQDLGQIDEKEASVHPNRNVLYRALGQSEPFRPDLNTYTLPSDGYLLICSDGLWGPVSDVKMAQIVLSAPNLATAAQNLVDAANDEGGPDNISAILVQYLG